MLDLPCTPAPAPMSLWTLWRAGAGLSPISISPDGLRSDRCGFWSPGSGVECYCFYSISSLPLTFHSAGRKHAFFIAGASSFPAVATPLGSWEVARCGLALLVSLGAEDSPLSLHRAQGNLRSGDRGWLRGSQGPVWNENAGPLLEKKKSCITDTKT